MKTFYFMFSSGEYSDFSTGDFCSCDHEVSQQQWEAHYVKYQAALKAKRPNLHAAAENSSGPTWKSFGKWVEENNPEKSFQKLHGMTVLKVEEFWRDI